MQHTIVKKSRSPLSHLHVCPWLDAMVCQVAYTEAEVKKILSIRCEEEDVEMAEDALDLLTRFAL